MISASLPPRIIEQCLARDRIIINTVVSEYCNHAPRVSAECDSGKGHRLGNQPPTLDGWVRKVGELLIPMFAAMRRELISGSYIQADETPVDVQMHEGRRKN